ncbi:acyl-CoA synthetase [Rhodobacteraceae bacterium CCMM004]|nr:acyl-CoA synthetase [Rhodobacteraceae bacterium CCMM004]
MGWLDDETGLGKCAANHVPLSPLSHLARAARVFPAREAIAYGARRWSYADYRADATRLAAGLRTLGLTPGDVVATLLPNVPAQAIAAFGIPAMGGVLNTINVRLEDDTVGYILDHGGARALICDTQFLPLAEAAIARQEGPAPALIEVPDPAAGYPATGRYTTFDDLLAAGDPQAAWTLPQDEWESLALNYTSGTTGRPKGVVYHHRGAYLMTMGTVVSWQMTLYPRFLAIVPLFHCNGWCHTWMMPLLGGCVVCCRDISAAAIYDALADEGVTHFGGAPIVLSLLVQAGEDERRPFDQTVSVMTAGAPPAPATLAAMERLGFEVMQVYGLTETYGHVTECLWDADWDAEGDEARAARKARQGVAMPMMEAVTVLDKRHRQIPMDGRHQGEVGMRGNCVMKGYYRNPAATEEAFAGGWFHSGDIAVQHPDGHIQISDRAKDIIISGGENVSSVEVEAALMAHPDVALCAVVAMPDDTWGEVPCAFVERRRGGAADEAALIAFARGRLAGFKTPKRVVFQDLPKTSTGKIQKYVLRQTAAAL